MDTTTIQGLITKMTLTAWTAQNNSFVGLLSTLSDDQLSNEIAPGKNSGTYLLGHLVAVSDAMLPLLGFGEKLYPELENVFITSPDRSGLEKPSVAVLRGYLEAVNQKLKEHMQSVSDAEWLERHTAVSPEAFAKEPHRNKLNIIISRTNHMAYHLGQIALLKQMEV